MSKLLITCLSHLEGLFSDGRGKQQKLLNHIISTDEVTVVDVEVLLTVKQVGISLGVKELTGK